MQAELFSDSGALQSGALIAGRYTLLRELARGGMGSVWEGTDSDNGLHVALKFQTSQGGADAHARRFAREVAALRALSHPHVVSILDSGWDNGLSYIVMELLRGATLRERLADGSRLELSVAKDVIAQTALGLAAAHAAGVVHRDIKPSNLFLIETGRGAHVKILDFGIARPIALDTTASCSLLLGSPPYMSPEQARHLPLDERTDLWSLAVVAFEVLSGVGPFSADDLPATLQRICRGEARAFGKLRPDLPPALRGFFRRAFTVDPALRFQNAIELAQHFSRACEGHLEPSRGRIDATQPIPAHAAASVWRSRRRAAAALTAVLVVFTASKAWTVAQRQHDAPPPHVGQATAVPNEVAVSVMPPVAPGLTSTTPAAALTAKPADQQPRIRSTRVVPNSTASIAPSVSAAAPGAGSAQPATTSSAPAATPYEPRNPLDRRF